MSLPLLRRIREAGDPAISALLESSDDFHSALYPPESIHTVPLAAFLNDSGAFFAAYRGNVPVACGGILLLDDDGRYGEIKRLFVAAEHRGYGFAKSIMSKLEQFALEAGVTVARLETGTSQPEAIGLYRQMGYTLRGPFGKYGLDPYSVFMEKTLLRDTLETKTEFFRSAD